MDVQAIKNFLLQLTTSNLLWFMLISLFLCVAWIFLCLRLDRESPEPPKQIIRIFFWGGLMVFPTLFITGPISSFINQLSWLSGVLKIIILSFLVDGLIEEFVKFCILSEKVYKEKSFDEPRDGLIYGMIIGIGFSLLENFFFGLTLMGVPGGLLIIVARGIITTFMHLLAGGIIGYCFGLAKFKAHGQASKKEGSWLVVRGLIFAILFHGLYNLVIRFSYAWLMIPLSIFLIGVYIYIIIGLRRTQVLFNNHTL